MRQADDESRETGVDWGCEVACAWRGDRGYAGLQRSARVGGGGLGRAMHAILHEKGTRGASVV